MYLLLLCLLILKLISTQESFVVSVLWVLYEEKYGFAGKNVSRLKEPGPEENQPDEEEEILYSWNF